MSKGNGHPARDHDRVALDTLRDVLKDAGLAPSPLEEVQGYAVAFEGEGPDVDGLAHILDGEDRFVFLLVFRKTAPKARRDQVMEFITRANYGMSIGCFEMDLSDGEVRYRTGVDYRGQRLPAWLIRNSIVAAMDAVELYCDSLEDVMKGQLDAVKAIEQAESQADEDGD